MHAFAQTRLPVHHHLRPWSQSLCVLSVGRGDRGGFHDHQRRVRTLALAPASQLYLPLLASDRASFQAIHGMPTHVLAVSAWRLPTPRYAVNLAVKSDGGKGITAHATSLMAHS